MIETITLGIAITLVVVISGAIWRLSQHIHKIEKEITNDHKHDLLRIEDKIDSIKDDVSDIKERIAHLEH